jgi:predicted DNA-binding transcriptional regulator YafY
MDNTMIRQWTELRMIPRHPRRIDAPSIHRKLETMGIYVTLRTVQRDLNDLCSTFPLRSDQLKPQGWWFEKDFSLEIPGMDPHAALTFNLVEQYMKQLLPPATLSHLAPWFKTARGISQSETSIVSKWQDKIRVIPHTLNMIPVQIDEKIQADIYDGLLHGKQMEITYKAINRSHEAKTYTVHPLGIVAMEQVIYLVCTIKEYSDPRFLAMHRIDNAVLLEQAVIIPEGYVIDKFIAREFGIRLGPKPLKLVLRVRGLLGKYLAETPLAQGQQVSDLDDGWTRVEVTVPDTVQLRTWIMSLGKNAVVDRPAALRKEIGTEARQLMAHYD